jgi:lipoprotein-anchoring transpeptidase ErfK/SrfK
MRGRALAGFVFCAAVTAAAQAGAAPTVRLMSAHRVFDRPDRGAGQQAVVQARRPLTLARTILPVVERRVWTGGQRWMKVAVPGRPNSHTGWIRAQATREASSPWRVVVQLGPRRVSVTYRDRLVRTFPAVVGAPATPTPTGRFFVEESVALAPGLAGAPVALALSARSDVLEQFAGGPGQIAIHGRGGVGGVPGTAVSHGCIRLQTRAITWMAAHIGAGVRVRIRRLALPPARRGVYRPISS